jgi:CDP-6-deoxy-D-xylo-4-hexulose-3-dehydrase
MPTVDLMPTIPDREKVLAQVRDLLAPHLQIQTGPGDRVPLNAPTFTMDEVMEALDSLLTTKVTMGDKVGRFESQFAQYIGKKHAVMVNSGSSANLLIMAGACNPAWKNSLRLQPGDEVLVPAVTWSTTLWPVINLGCVPVLVDADPRTLNICPKAAKAAVTPKTKAIFLAHILGNAADMDAFQALAKEHNLLLLEDSCEALGTKYKGHLTGHFGFATSYSFFFSHHITTIEGGMIVTDDDDFADLLRCLRAHGWSRHMHQREKIEKQYPQFDPRFLFVNIGYNLRPTEIQAAFGLHQLPKLADFNHLRERVAQTWRAAFADIDELQMIEPTEGVQHTWFGFPVLLRGNATERKAEFIRFLEANGIETRPVIAGNLAEQPALKLFPHRIAGALPGADQIMKSGIYWGSHPMMTDAQVQHVATTVRRFFRGSK